MGCTLVTGVFLSRVGCILGRTKVDSIHHQLMQEKVFEKEKHRSGCSNPNVQRTGTFCESGYKTHVRMHPTCTELGACEQAIGS